MAGTLLQPIFQPSLTQQNTLLGNTLAPAPAPPPRACGLSPLYVCTQSFDSLGRVLAGGKIYTYLAGTTTPTATYITSDKSQKNANPITLDASGRYSQEIWLDCTLTYKFVLADSGGNVLSTYDNITGIDCVGTETVNAAGISPVYDGQQQHDAQGRALAYGKIYTYVGGTTQPLATYSDVSMSSANPNPIVLDAGGNPTVQIWLDCSYTYKFILKDANDNVLHTADYIVGANCFIATTPPKVESLIVVPRLNLRIPEVLYDSSQLSRALEIPVTGAQAAFRIADPGASTSDIWEIWSNDTLVKISTGNMGSLRATEYTWQSYIVQSQVLLAANPNPDGSYDFVTHLTTTDLTGTTTGTSTVTAPNPHIATWVDGVIFYHTANNNTYYMVQGQQGGNFNQTYWEPGLSLPGVPVNNGFSEGDYYSVSNMQLYGMIYFNSTFYICQVSQTHGSWLATYATEGTSPLNSVRLDTITGFNGPYSIAIDQYNNNVFVLDNSHSKLIKFSAGLGQLGLWDLSAVTNGSTGFAVYNDRIAVTKIIDALHSNLNLYRLNSDGTTNLLFSGPGYSPQPYILPLTRR